MTVFSKCFAAFLISSVLMLPALAQTPSTADPKAPDETAAKPTPPAQEPAAPATPTWSVGPIDFSGLVDGYYSFNSNHPASQVNQLYNFNDKTNQFSLNMAKLSLAHSPDPVGFQIDMGFGRAFEIFNRQPTEKASDTFRFLEQAYLSIKPPKAKGLEVDFGKFVTSAGAEVIGTNENWNYSRSLLFSFAIPYYHFGVRTSIPIGKYFTGGVQIVNGWNNIGDNNSGKTIGLTGTITTKKFAWSNTYYAGPENNDTSKGWRHMYDTVVVFTPSTKFNGYINFDYGQNTNFSLVSGVPVPGVPSLSKWYGLAGALHLQVNSHWSFTPRVEWFKDKDGFATGVAQDLKEFTLTGEYKMVEGLLARLEYRRDWTNQPFFDYGGVLGSKKSQNTATLGVLAYFGPKR